MDRNNINKVYINPNFKKAIVKTQPNYEYSNHLDYYLQRIQNNQLDANVGLTNSNRKIYLNPNFKQVKETKNLTGNDYKDTRKEETSVISKSKYSLVNKLAKKEYEEKNNKEATTHCNLEKTEQKIYLNRNIINKSSMLIKNNLKVIPIFKSRYSIVRKNTPATVSKIENSLSIPTEVQTSVFTSYSSNINPKANISNERPAEKVTKIKLSKYKTVPITYLKKCQAKVVKTKELDRMREIRTEFIKSNTYSYTNVNTASKNRFKFTRLSPKVNTEGITSKIHVQQIPKKIVWQSHSKVKLKKGDFKLNNIPCRLFIKYGKCLRKDYGKCEYLHDRKHVSLCRKFIKGICHDANCLLSHELTANKMPTCYFYLKGICVKENCPYLHVKLSDKIKICQNFLKGYCENGDKCIYRHVKKNVSKKVETTLIVTSRAPSKNTRRKKISSKNINKKRSSLKDKNDAPHDSKEIVDCRYYKDTGNNEICENIKPTRCKLGNLPSFIQL